MAGKPDIKAVDNLDAHSARGLASARRVLTAESAALEQLIETIDERFASALDLLEEASGRIIVTGMGKSGHIARKIAATLASTGSPAQYVHPGEASHGDLGMITARDAVIALSNSGNTAELSDILAYCSRFTIPLIGITAGAESQLARNAKVALVLPTAEEACPMGLAPTTSTTMMLALGDAIAVALLERKGFSVDDFQTFHPGGALGQQLVRISEIMRQGEDLPLCQLETAMPEVILLISEKRLGCAGVVDGEGVLAGIITDGDLRRHLDDRFMTQTAQTVMTAGPKTIRADALAAEALAIMERHAIKDLFVLDESGKPAGVVTIHDLLRAGVA